ncbi:MAG: zinc ribbon domain-containing protein [Acidobacteria bacterium]|nr:zinc ribbon domain-containing protein [Acidobacteriota bacterium]
MTCANCRASVPAGQKFCDHCGAPMQPAQATQAKPKSSTGRWVAALVVLLVAVGLLGYRVYLLNRPAEKASVTLQEAPAPAPAPPATAPSPPTPAPPAIRETPPPVEKRAAPVTPPTSAPVVKPPVSAPPAATPAQAASEPPPPPEATPERPPPARKGIVPFRPDTSEPAPPPRATAPAEPAVEAPAPAPVREQPAPYQGPSAGTLIWSGQIEKGLLVKIERDQVSVGRLTGELPGVPVSIELQTDAFAVVEGPSPANNWKRLYLRSVKRIRTAVVIKWVVR